MASNMYVSFKQTSNRVGPRACSISTAIGLALPISMIVMGALYLDDCPAERYIPIYLIVSGCFSIILALLRVMGSWFSSKEDRPPATLESISGVISLFLFAWFITGNVWIYRLYDKYSTDSADPNYCDNTLYLYAFWVTIATYIVLGLFLLICCCTCICIGCCGRSG